VRPGLILPWLLLILAFQVNAATYSLPGAIGSGPFSSCSLFSAPTYRCSALVSIGNNDTVNLTASVTLDITSNGFFAGNNVTINSNGFSFQVIAREDVNIGNSFDGQISISAPGKTINTGNTFNIIGSLSAGTLNIGNSSTVTGICTPANAKCTGLPPLASYRFDEASWSGAANQVIDSSANGNHAQSFNSATTAAATPAISTNPGTCNYGVFSNGSTITQGYVKTSLPNLTTNFTITAWIRTFDRAFVGSRIFLDDDNNSSGYGFSIDNGAGALRFYSRNINPVILDSTYTLQNNVWYFVAAVANITSKRRSIHVFNSTGTLLNTTSDSPAYTGTWGTDPGPVAIGGDTNAATDGATVYHFQGNIDEVNVYQQALDQATLATLATRTHACAAASGPDHYELSAPSSSIACLPSTITVTACANSSSPCTSAYTTSMSGKTATLATSVGTLGATTVTFNASGVATTTLSYPAASNNTAVTVTLSGEQTAATNSRKCCPNGVGCSVANSCSSTFNTAGFIVSSTAGGAAATIPTQTAGTASGSYYLRAVQTNTTTGACTAALTGTQTISFANQCASSPTICNASNLMSVTGTAATTIASNPAAPATPATYTSVGMNFDASGNAPFSFTYGDVGNVMLWATATASSATLIGSSNSFTVKPAYFDTAITYPTGCSGFLYSGKSFTETVTARATGGGATPSYSGTGTTMTLSEANGVAGSLGTSSVAASSFDSGGIANVTQAYTFSSKTTVASTIKLRAVDSNSVSSSTGSETTGSVRSGRLWLGNAYGSDQVDLVLPFETQYWNGSAFVKNMLDNCTVIASGNVALGNKQAGLASYAGTVTGSAAISGAGTITLAKPASAAYGSVDVLVRLGGSSGNCKGVTGGISAGYGFLAGKWCGATYTYDPVARATFGIATQKGIIFLREVY
jgi:MSHA biogenesis protein MshQ